MPRGRLPTLMLAAALAFVALACAAPGEARAAHPAPRNVVADPGISSVRPVANRQSLFFLFPRRSSTRLGPRPVDSVFKLLRGGFGRREADCSRQLRNGWTITVSDPIRQSAGVYTMRVAGWRECLFLPPQGVENFVDWRLRLEFHQVVHQGEPVLALRVTVTSVRGAQYTDFGAPEPPPGRFREAEIVRAEEGLNAMTSWMGKTFNAQTDALPQVFADNYGAAP